MARHKIYTEVYVLTQTDRYNISTICCFTSWDKCIDQIKEEFIESGMEFTSEHYKKLDNEEFLDTPKYTFRIDLCEVF